MARAPTEGVVLFFASEMFNGVQRVGVHPHSNLEWDVQPPPNDVEDMTCIICYNIMSHPVYVACCKRRFCEECLKSHLETSDPREVWPCPVCRTVCIDGYFRDLELVTRMTKYKVKCLSPGCDWKSLAGVEVHYCPLSSIRCRLCRNDIVRKDMATHLKTVCPYLYRLCDCGKYIPRDEFEAHVDQCGEVKVLCDQCGEFFFRRQMPEHECRPPPRPGRRWASSVNTRRLRRRASVPPIGPPPPPSIHPEPTPLEQNLPIVLSEDSIQFIMDSTGCTRELAEEALYRTSGDLDDALSHIRARRFWRLEWPSTTEGDDAVAQNSNGTDDDTTIENDSSDN